MARATDTALAATAARGQLQLRSWASCLGFSSTPVTVPAGCLLGAWLGGRHCRHRQAGRAHPIDSSATLQQLHIDGSVIVMPEASCSKSDSAQTICCPLTEVATYKGSGAMGPFLPSQRHQHQQRRGPVRGLDPCRLKQPGSRPLQSGVKRGRGRFGLRAMGWLAMLQSGSA